MTAANSLIKDTTLETVVGTEEVAAIPYRAPVPARTVYENRYICAFRYSGAGHYTYVTDPQTYQVAAVWVPDSISGGGGAEGGVYSCQWETVPVNYPAIPAQPYVPGHTIETSEVVTGFNLGWNSGGRSIGIFTDDGAVTFQVRESVVGVIAGINVYDGIDARYSGATIDYAFICQRGLARIMRNGIVGLSLGAYDESVVFKIDRVGGVVTWYMNGSSVFSISGEDSSTAAWLEAALYSGGDEVFNPTITQVSAADTTAQTGVLAGSLAPMSMMAADRVYGAMNASLAPLAFEGSSGYSIPAYGLANFVLPPLSATFTGLTGGIGTLSAALAPMGDLFADHPYGELKGALAPLQSTFDGREGNFQASMAGRGALAGSIAAANFLVVTMSSAGHFTATMVAAREVSAQMLSEASAGSEMALNAVLQAVMVSMAKSGAVIGVPASDSETWVLNIDSSGSTTYSGYGFNSYAQIGGRYYGARSDGIYLLEGDTDDGAPIRASISLGELDFGTPNLKTVSECYVGMSGNGNLYLKLIAEGRAFIYKTRSFSPRMQQQRMTSGKGLRTNYVTAELFNENGSDFELDTVLFQVADLSRRI